MFQSKIVLLKNVKHSITLEINVADPDPALIFRVPDPDPGKSFGPGSSLY